MPTAQPSAGPSRCFCGHRLDAHAPEPEPVCLAFIDAVIRNGVITKLVRCGCSYPQPLDKENQ